MNITIMFEIGFTVSILSIKDLIVLYYQIPLNKTRSMIYGIVFKNRMIKGSRVQIPESNESEFMPNYRSVGCMVQKAKGSTLR